jgi:hypothetical protein
MNRIIIVFLMSYSHAQVKIYINAGINSSVGVLQNNGGDPESNDLIINNGFDKNNCTVIITQPLSSGSSTFNFNFGKNGMAGLMKGENKFIFNSSGTIVSYPDKKQHLNSPCRIQVLDENSKILSDTTIDYKNNENSKDEGNKNESNYQSRGLTKIPYYDALSLTDYKKLGLKEFREILNYYRFKQDTINGDDIKLLNAFKDNAFLFNELQAAINDGDWYIHTVSAPKLDLSGLSLPSIGGLDVTTIADGFARFIVKRAKTELGVAFFDKFKTELSKPQYKDMQSLFPQTYRALTAIGDEIYNYESYIQTLRECFEKDLANLITNMPKIIENHDEFFRLQPELKAILGSAFYIGQQLQDKQSPGDITANYPDTIWKDCNPNYRAAFQTLKMVSASLRNKEDDQRYWISSADVKNFTDNDKAFRIYMGLLIQVAKKDSIKFQIEKKESYLSDILNASYATRQNDLPAYISYIKKFGQKTEILSKKINGLKKTDNDSLLLENYYGFFSSVIDFLKFTTAIEDLPHFRDLGLNLKKKSDEYLEAAQTAADIVIDVNRRNYASGIVNVFHLYSTIFSEKNIEGPLVLIEEEEKKSAENYKTELKSLDDFKHLLAKEKDPVKKVKLNNDIQMLEEIRFVLIAIYKYGSFMSSIVEAKTSEDVAKAIESAALPTGSSRIKRETRFNVSLNSYIGLFLGYEQIRGFDTTGFKVNAFGISAPIGFAISRGHSVFFIGTGKSGWSTSAFVSIIDIGAIAAFRVKDDSTSQVPTIQLQDIISPGLFLSIGIPKCPVSVNFGVQMGPNLRAVTSTANNYSNSIYLRYSLSVVVDIPIFNFYSKGK